MEFFTTKIVDQAVQDKIQLEEVNSILSTIELPDKFQDIHKIIVTFIVREPNDFEFDIWQKKDKIYLTIPLPYQEVLNTSEEEITNMCSKLFKYYAELE